MTQSVLIVGSSTNWSLESSYARGFQRLGWDTYFWEPQKALYNIARGYRVGRLLSTFLHVESWLRKSNAELLTVADKLRPNLILVIGTGGVRAGTLAQIKVRSPECAIFCIYPDSPHNLDSDRIHCLPFFDLVATSSPAWKRAFELLGAGRVRYLPFASDIDLHQPYNAGGRVPEVTYDVSFIGTWRPEREELLERLVEFKLSIWGNDYWKRRTSPESTLRSRWGGRQAVGNEFAKVCSESRVLLNIMDTVTWPGPNMRVFEQPACGAFSLVSRTPAVLELFTEGENIECFESAEEARDKVRYYISHDSERQQIAQAGYRLVVQGGHTYVDRARQVVEWIESD